MGGYPGRGPKWVQNGGILGVPGGVPGPRFRVPERGPGPPWNGPKGRSHGYEVHGVWDGVWNGSRNGSILGVIFGVLKWVILGS